MIRFVATTTGQRLWGVCVLFLMGTAIAAAQDSAATPAWVGPYGGVSFGVLGGASEWTASPPNGAETLSGSVSLYQPFNGLDGSGSHFGGLVVGYNRRLPSGVVVGAEGDVSFAAEPVGTTDRFSETAELFGTVRGRLGYGGSRWLMYGTGGFAWTHNQFMFVSPGSGASGPDSQFSQRIGWTFGAGIERTLAAGWSANAEYLYSRYGSTDVVVASNTPIATSLSTHQVRVGLRYAWANDRPEEETSRGLAPLAVDGWSAHGQTTFLVQFAPPFTAPYRGPNSLASNAGRETWDVTLYLGRQLWRGAALWINPEIDQGFGLTDTLGVAGFTSGEAYKVGYSNPYLRVPRVFIQQTINLGGMTETEEAGLNQFAGFHTVKRLVVTVGKFSVSDLFDTITYAHDPRNDFMNWSLVDAGTFDYAADAWGFTYGAALEWYQHPWTARVGVFDLSNVPNSVELDSNFGQWQLVYELAHQHEIRGEPGQISVVGFVSRGRMGTFADALAFAAQNGTVPSTADVRRYNTRPGVNLNFAQQVTENVGVFGRVGWANGQIEPYEFTDIDRTASAGVAVDGRRWGRPNDTLGVAAVVNGIADIHRAYLAAGGLGILVGDGQLPHPGAESIVESYYRFPIGAWQLTADYQFIVNPAFNRDRGPVSVVSLRLHAQF